MSYGLYLSASGAEVQRQRIEVMANNLANVDTPGFRREMAVAQARHAEAIERGNDSPGGRSINDLGGGVSVRETVTETQPGKLAFTKQKTDLAIVGEGYFVVERDGEQLLTRAGDFTLNERGELTTSSGHRVLNEQNQPIVITDPDWRLAPYGAVEQPDGATLLKLVDVPAGDLQKRGENLYASLSDPTPVRPERRQVRSGHLEMSNVSPTTQMMELIEASRAYESNIRMIQNHDQLVGNLLSRVLRAN